MKCLSQQNLKWKSWWAIFYKLSYSVGSRTKDREIIEADNGIVSAQGCMSKG